MLLRAGRVLAQRLALALVLCLHGLSGSLVRDDPAGLCSGAKVYQGLVTIGLVSDDATFCPLSSSNPAQPRLHCCSGNWTRLFPMAWTRLAAPFASKLTGMEAGLKKGIEDIKGMTCPPSPLQATTLTLLSQLVSENRWSALLDSTPSPECRLKIVQAVTCPGICEPSLNPSPPCRNLCVNTLRGCVSELVKLASPWKHAMNSVRTALRMLSTNKESGCTTPSSVDSLLGLLNSWREPLQWLDSGCEELPVDNCFNGKDVSSYTKSTAPLGSSSNPEFPFSELPAGGGNRGSTPVFEFKKMLDSVTETLADHWPRLPDDDSGADVEEDMGSGLGPNARQFFNTDDEDLLSTSEFGSGSGDGPERDLDHFDTHHHPSTELDNNSLDESSRAGHERPTVRTPPAAAAAGSPSQSSSISLLMFWLVLWALKDLQPN